MDANEPQPTKNLAPSRAHPREWAVLVTLALAACAHAPQTRATPPRDEPAPAWVAAGSLSAERLCGVGIAGAGFKDSPYPKQLAARRAARNLAGTLGTTVRDVMIDEQSHRGTSVRYFRDITVNEELVEQVAQAATYEYWLDGHGAGPFAQPGFTYALACLDGTSAERLFKTSAAELQRHYRNDIVPPTEVPAWIHATGKQPPNRLCAVGFSLPMFHPDKTFDAVVEDVRAQLAEVIQSFVSAYYEELTTGRVQLARTMNTATNEAISKGAVITHYWYDEGGIGPFSRARTTYGWGCVYPVEVLRESLAKVEQEAQGDDQAVVARVRAHASDAFEALEREIDARESPARDTSEAPSEDPTSAAAATPLVTPTVGAVDDQARATNPMTAAP